MKNLIIITIIGLFVNSLTAQSFVFKDLVIIKKMPIEGKRKVLKDKGFHLRGPGKMLIDQALDTRCEVWVMGCQQMRINDESIEYGWEGDSLYIVKKSTHKTIYSNISRDMFNSTQKYLFMKRRTGTYDMGLIDEGKSAKSEFTYLRGDDVFIRSNYEAQFVFVGNLSGLVN